MKPGPKMVADLIIDAVQLDGAPRPLDGLIEEVIDQHPEWHCDPIEKGGEWYPAVEGFLRAHLEGMLQQGKQPRVIFNSSSPYMIQGACFCEPIDTEEAKQQKRKRLHLQSYYSALQSMSPREFEILCSRVLNLLGVSDPELTQYQGDQGIDFYGRLSFGDLVGHGPTFPVFETSLIIWLVGQAKHYTDVKVATPDIRELVGSVTLGRARSFPRSDIFPSLTVRVCDPVIMLFFTTGQVSSTGWALCRQSGVAAMDGEMLAAFLADKGVAMVGDGDKRAFNPATFRSWLKEGSPKQHAKPMASLMGHAVSDVRNHS